MSSEPIPVYNPSGFTVPASLNASGISDASTALG